MNYKVELDNLNSILSKRGLQERGRIQQFIASELVRVSDKRVPLKTGMLKNTARVINGGKEVHYPQPYAARQYYSTPQTRSYDPQRGSYWFERTKNAEGKDIINKAARMAGGRAT